MPPTPTSTRRTSLVALSERWAGRTLRSVLNRVKLAAWAILLGGCVSLSKEAPGCVTSEECQSGVCAFGACRSLCESDSECGRGGTCYALGHDDEGVCSLPEERACTVDAECPSELICAHGACGTSCDETNHCVQGQSCKQGACTADDDSSTNDDSSTDDDSSDAGTDRVPSNRPTTGSSVMPMAGPILAPAVTAPNAMPDAPATTSTTVSLPPGPVGDPNEAQPMASSAAPFPAEPVPIDPSAGGAAATLDAGAPGGSDATVAPPETTAPNIPMTSLSCGNGLLELGEQCDDGNLVVADGCSDQCVRDEGWACTNVGEPCLVDCKVTSLPEVCGANDAGACNFECVSENCGDGIVDPLEEECDNAFNVDGYFLEVDDCGPGCVIPAYCGDGFTDLDFAEMCDNGGLNSNLEYGGCTTACQLGPRCGDGALDSEFEACDDGNRSSDDGCDAECRIEDAF